MTAATSLGWDDPLAHRPRRILVSGVSGAGKSTLARALAATLSLPYHELDALYHGPGWVPRPQFISEVSALAATEGWVTEWQYSAVRPVLLARADLLVWLDLPRWRVMSQLVRRTLIRRLRRIELWNGNLEPPLWTLFTERDHILRWAWRAHPRNRTHIRDVLAAPHSPVVVRLRNRREIRHWLAGPIRQATHATLSEHDVTLRAHPVLTREPSDPTFGPESRRSST